MRNDYETFPMCDECCGNHDPRDGFEHCPGWLHMDECGDAGPGIERCDACAHMQAPNARTDDIEALAAHNVSGCNCGAGLAQDPCWDRDALHGPQWERSDEA